MATDPAVRLSEALQAERENAALICDDLAGRWERAAARFRTEGTFKRGWPFRGTFVSAGHERAARDVEAAAHGLRRVSELIREGVRALPDTSAALTQGRGTKP